MEQLEQQSKPRLAPELIELYNRYIHGEIDRRSFMDGAGKFAIGGLTATAIWEMLKPNYALGQQVAPTDARLKTSRETVPSPQGNGNIKGYLVRPTSAGTGKLPAIIVVHENRGLNPHIEDVARRIALEGFMTFAPDGLTSVGGFPASGDDAQGMALFNMVDRAKMTEDMLAAAIWLKARPDSTGKIGATGFCFGGGVSNTLAVRMGADLAAAVPYYGQAAPVADVPKIKAAILVQHGATDTNTNRGWAAYDTALTAANVPHEGYLYEGAGHGFNNDATKERYNEAAAKLAWSRTIAWFNKYVKA